MRQKSLGLLGEIKKYGSRLEHMDRLAGRTVKIGYGRDFIVGANRQKAGFELLVLGDVNHLDPVVEFHFLERDRNLASVWGVKSKKRYTCHVDFLDDANKCAC